MNRPRADQPLTLSLMDRLAEDPQGGTRPHTVEDLRASVRRDLEALLNGRQCPRSHDPELAELDRSLVAYGLPDLATLNVATPEQRDEFRYVLERKIANFEPRLSSVSVSLLENADQFDRTLRFRIDAIVHAAAHREAIAIESAVDPGTRAIKLTGRRDG